MDLIVKPTEACNFKCTFCSSTDIDPNEVGLLDLNYIYKFLERWPDCNTIIVNGGDPLMVKPEWYQELIDHLDEHDYKASISFTSNLWPFLMRPEKWLPIFQNKRFGCATSFQ